MTKRSKKKNKKKKTSSSKRKTGSRFSKIIAISVALSILALAVYTLYLDNVIRHKFDGKRWSLPAVVYARPLELYSDLQITPEQLEKELQLAGYRKESRQPAHPGGYVRKGDIVQLVSRDFYFPAGLEKSNRLTVQFSGNKIKRIKNTDTEKGLPIARLDPARIGSFHPRQHEDRIVLSREDLPELLIKTLLAVEDQKFYSHHGLSPLSIARAMLVNLRAGKTVQGGSTLTQQLVKNFFLTNKRTVGRKFNEAIMALLLELHYSKDEILTAYVNEIFLGQDGGRAVHGFALASLFYFRRDLEDLSTEQVALLVGMVKGPSYYDPRRNKQRCRKRRQVVLGIMRAQSIIGDYDYSQAKSTPIDLSGKTMHGFNRFPAFLDVVRRQLRQDFREEDLTTDGLKILTTLDPQVQWQVEEKLARTIAEAEKRTGRKELQGAVIVSNRESGEILAVAGGRKPLQSGFNRATHAKRPVGSLIKPAVYLAAIESGYTLTTMVEDKSITLPGAKGEKWTPRNYDRKEHGTVPFYQALAHSYNMATVRIGMDVGLTKVLQTVKKLGIDRDFPSYPSFLLGSAAMTPMEVSQMYQTLAAGGFYLPQRVIGSVLASDNTTLNRFGLSVEQRFSPQTIFILNYALQLTVSEGTGKSLAGYIPVADKVAGKTGTSNDFRDSWFAGFSGDKLIVVWLGRDDNKPTGLTGATGALVAWGKIMQGLYYQPLDLIEPPGIKWLRFDQDTLDPVSRFNYKGVKFPFIDTTVPEKIRISSPDRKKSDLGQSILNTIQDLFR